VSEKQENFLAWKTKVVNEREGNIEDTRYIRLSNKGHHVWWVTPTLKTTH
jgi:hypothetical protein